MPIMAADAQTCEFLAQALLYPGGTFARKLAARAQALAGPPAWAQRMVRAFSAETLEDLQVEHVRLFVNAYGGAPCLPYESVYAEGQALGEVAQGLAALYAEWGVEDTGEMPDYAAVELAFAAQLARLQPVLPGEEERQRAGQAAAAFERVHLRAWLPVLGAGLQAAAELAFYRELGEALQAVFGAAAPRPRQERTNPGRDPDVDSAT
jgi:TorA maturation chaperone TorD